MRRLVVVSKRDIHGSPIELKTQYVDDTRYRHGVMTEEELKLAVRQRVR